MLKKYFDEDKYELTKKSDNLIYKALEIVTTLFEHDKDKGGMPYMLHIIYVYKHVNSIEEKVIALLHDVIEDTDYTYDDLRKLGFNKQIISALELMTHDDNVPYMEYVAAIKTNPIARAVKIADLRHNSDLSRIDVVTPRDMERAEKYKKAIEGKYPNTFL